MKGRELWSEAEPEVYDETDPKASSEKTPESAGTTPGSAVTPGVEDVDSDGVLLVAPVPEFEEFRINRLMQQLNQALRSVTADKDFEQEDIIVAYNRLIKKTGWKTNTDRRHFPIMRFKRHLHTVFPEGENMQVSENRLSWSCPLCPGVGQDLSNGDVYHKQNVSKHFRSADHCARVASLSSTTAAVESAVEEHHQTKIVTDSVAEAVRDDAVISCSRKALSFTTIPVVLQVVARALFLCRGKEEIPVEEIKKIHKVSKRGARAIQRMQSLVKAETVRGNRTRPTCVRGRHWVANRMMELGKACLKKKVDFLLSCDYLSCSCDESDTYSSSAPMASALQGCSFDFHWANLFMGQSDASEDKTGEGCWKLLRDQLNGIDDKLLARIKWLCTDGASAMRSTPMYAGLDSKPDGTSLHAFMKREVDPDLPNLHGLAHSGDLALKKALKICADWTTTWLNHIKALYNWFAKSPQRKSTLKSLHKTMLLLQRVVTWRMCLPKYHCPTRWVGLYTALVAYLNGGDLVIIYVDKLELDGYRPYRTPQTDPEEAETARVDDPEDDENGEARFHEDSFHVWGEDPWDLTVTKPVGDVDILSEDERIEMDPKAKAWKELDPGTKKKRTRLMNEDIGLTTMNFGISSMMCDILKPYKVLTEQLQTQTHPIGHRVRQYVCTLFKCLNRTFLSDSPSFGQHFNKWMDRTEVTEAMGDQVKAMGRQFVYVFLDNLRFRYQPYWTAIMAMETINPCAPHRLSPDAWIGVKDLVKRCLGDNINADDVVDELQRQHEEAESWCLTEVKACTANLLRYYHDRLQACKDNKQSSKYPLAEKFARLVFSLHLASAIIETYFSKTKYIKNLHRSTMRDSLSSATLHVQQLRPYMDEDVIEMIGDIDIDKVTALSCAEHDLHELREKYVNQVLTKRFQDDDAGGIVRPYKGTITDVYYDQQDGQHMFHVTYDSDSDDEDMEQWEVSTHIAAYRASI